MKQLLFSYVPSKNYTIFQIFAQKVLSADSENFRMFFYFDILDQIFVKEITMFATFFLSEKRSEV